MFSSPKIGFLYKVLQEIASFSNDALRFFSRVNLQVDQLASAHSLHNCLSKLSFKNIVQDLTVGLLVICPVSQEKKKGHSIYKRPVIGISRLLPKAIGNRKRDCAWGCAWGINTTWENLKIEKHKSVRWAERTPSWFVLFDLQIFSGGVYSPSATSRTISFSIPIVFGINFDSVFRFFRRERRTVQPEIRSFALLLPFPVNHAIWQCEEFLSLSISLSLSPNVPHAQYRKRFRASYIVREVHSVRERERERERDTEREREKDWSDVTIVALKLAMSFALLLAKNMHLSIGDDFALFLAKKICTSVFPLLIGAEFTLSVAKNVALFETVRILRTVKWRDWQGIEATKQTIEFSGCTVLLSRRKNRKN